MAGLRLRQRVGKGAGLPAGTQCKLPNSRPKGNPMKLNPEKTVVSLQINADLTTADLDALLRKLALLRSEMSPAVPENRAEVLEAGNVLVEDKPGLLIAQRQGGGFRLWLRHRGYGWLAYQIDNTSADTMAGFIADRADKEAVNLIKHNFTSRH